MYPGDFLKLQRQHLGPSGAKMASIDGVLRKSATTGHKGLMHRGFLFEHIRGAISTEASRREMAIQIRTLAALYDPGLFWGSRLSVQTSRIIVTIFGCSN